MDEPVDPGAAEAIRCADCARSDSLVEGLEPVDAMPLTAEAMAGFPDGVPRARGPRGLDRRQFLRTAALGMASVYAASRIDWTRAFEAAVADAASPSNQLVMVFLNGGNDGLNTVVPIGEHAAYSAARPQLARIQGPSTPTQVGSTPMPGTGGLHAWANPGVSGVGNNGDTKGFDSLWGDGSGGAFSCPFRSDSTSARTSGSAPASASGPFSSASWKRSFTRSQSISRAPAGGRRARASSRGARSGP